MAATVTANPGSCSSNASNGGTYAWGGLANVGAQDNTYATASGLNSSVTDYLVCTNYGFSIPAGSTINGISVGPWVNSTFTFTDNAMQLVKAGAVQPTNLAAGANTFPNGGGAMAAAPGQLVYGGSTNLWGNTWTVADINAANFGAAFAAQRGPYNTTQTVGVDAMPITVYYTPSAGGGGGGGGSCTTSTVGVDTVVTCTGNGSITIPASVSNVRYLVVGGGGGGGGNTGGWASAGGGAGGVLNGTGFAVTGGATYAVTVGAGGSGGTGGVTLGGNGGNSTFSTLTAIGGGGGASQRVSNNGANGGSGGGGRGNGAGGAGTAGQGNAGGNGGRTNGNFRSSGGGGGGGAAGATPTSDNGGNGGIGVSDNITGTATYYGGGGGGGGRNSGNLGGTGGLGGGATAPASGNGVAGTANTGGGGSGTAGGGGTTTGGGGGSGIVIIRYTATPPTAPTVTTNTASSITTTGATLNGTVSSNGASTTVTFDYGLTTTYGSSATAAQSPLASGATGTAVSAAVSGLSCNTTYHFRAKGVNSVGTTNGGDQTFTTSACVSGGVINTYYPGVGSVTAGATSITLGAATGAGSQINAGDMLLIMQMQDATMDSSNSVTYGTVSSSSAGKYEYAVAANSVPLSGGTLNISCGLLNSYADAAASGTTGQQRYQVIRVPVYTSTTLSSTLTALAWNGSTGGVLALDATGTVTLNGATVSVDGMGFRGGAARNSTSGSGANTDYVTPVSNLANGSKGEGIAGTPYYVLTPPGTATSTGIDGYPNGSFARGAPANGGGGATDIHPAANDQNPGGGGGGNGGGGGIGGIGWCPAFNTTAPTYGCGLASLVSATNPDGSTGGIGGNPVSGLGITKLTLGGGGGAGTTNNNTGTYGAPSSSGAPGGGIIMMRAGSLSGTATFNANGSNGDTSVRNDGSGGGGAGGAVLVSAGSGIGGLTINANGGTGGFNLVPPGSTATPHGPGGGGGGGYVITSGTPAATSVAGGSNGVTYNNGTLFTDATGSYGATPGSNGSVNSSLVTTAVPGTALGSTACPATIDHFAINIGGASGSTCAAKSITITAQNASNATVANYTGLVSITTAPAHGNWSGGTPTPGGSLTPGAADNGSASYQFVAGDNGVATFNFSDQHADGSLTISVADSSLLSTLSTSGAISFSDNAFVITNDSVQVAGRPQAMNVAMWRKDPTTGVCSVSSYYTGSKNLKAWLTVDAADPGGTSPSIGALSLPNAQPGATNLSLSFTAGSANFNLNTSDVGKYSLNLRDDSGTFATGGNIISGSSSVITTRPFALVVSGIKQGTTLNPANNSSGGSVFAKAGASFQATVGAYLWNSAADANSDGVPDTGTTLAQITANGATPGYKWTTTLAAGTPYTPATPLDTPSGTGTAGSFGNGVQSGTCPGGGPNCFSSGISTPTNLSYSEVGSFTLSASATGFLGTSGVDLTGANGLALVFDNTSPTPQRNGVVGRFIPDHFGVSANSITNRADLCPGASGCPSTFTYMGERMDAVFTLTALAAGGTTTKNYETSNGFAKLNPTAAANPLGLTALDDNGTTRTPLNPLDTSLPASCSPTPCFIGGVASVDAPIAVTRGATPTGPYTAVNVGINPSESDGVKTIYDIDTTNVVAGAPGHTRIGTTTEYYGRIKLSNVHGSELLDLPIAVTAEYYDGTSYVTSSADYISKFNTADLTFTNCQLLSAASTWPATCPPPTSPSPASVAFVNGAGSFTLSAPGANNTGSVDMNISVPSYLPSNTARATFGVYNNNSDFIYMREQY